MREAAAATFLARFETAGEAAARRLADALAGAFPDAGVAVFEQPAGWTCEAYFDAPPDAERLRAAAPGHGFALQTLAAKDWVKASLEKLTPVEAGRFVVHGAHDRARVAPNRVNIEIEAALAFGTGHHGTTRACLLALDCWCKRQKPRPKARRKTRPRRRTAPPAHILDLGTGTGVLAIAAARALRRPVLASDIDADALQVARANSRRNRSAGAIEWLHAAGLNARRCRARAPYALIFANILLGPLKRLAVPAARLLAPRGRLVFSGLLPEHGNAIIAAARGQNLALERRIRCDGWLTLVMRRENGN